MGHIDEFLRGHVASGLLPGEQIQGLAHVRQPQRWNALGVPQLYVHWLAVATTSRLILFRTEAGGLFESAPRPVAKDALIWCYDEIARVDVGLVEGLAIHSGGQASWFRLVPHPFAGPGEGDAIRYDVYPVAEGLSGQHGFMTGFARWLAGQVAGGAFPMSLDKRAALQRRSAASAEKSAREREAELERARQRQALIRQWQPTVVRFAVAAALLGGFLLSAVVLVRAIELNVEYTSVVARRPNDEYAQSTLRSSYVRAATGALGLLGSPSALVVLALADRKRRRSAALSQAA